MGFGGYASRFTDRVDSDAVDSDGETKEPTILHPKWEMTKRSSSTAVMGPAPTVREPVLDRRRFGILTHDALAPSKPNVPKISIAPLQTTRTRVPAAPSLLGPGVYLDGFRRGEEVVEKQLPRWTFGQSAVQKRTAERRAAEMGGDAMLARLLHRRWLRNLAKFEAAMVGPQRYDATADVLLPRVLYGGAMDAKDRRFPKFRKERPRLELDVDAADLKTRTRSLATVRMDVRAVSDDEMMRRQRGQTREQLRLATLRGPGQLDVRDEITHLRDDLGVKNWSATLLKTIPRLGRGGERPENPYGPGNVTTEFWGLVWRRAPATNFSKRAHSADPDVREKVQMVRMQRAMPYLGPGKYRPDVTQTKERAPVATLARGRQREKFLKDERRQELLSAWLEFGRAQPAVGEYEVTDAKPDAPTAPAFSMGKEKRPVGPAEEGDDGEGDTLMLDPQAAWVAAYDTSHAGVVLMEGQFGRGRSFSAPPAVDEDGEGDTLVLFPEQVKSRRQPVRMDLQVSRENGVYAIFNDGDTVGMQGTAVSPSGEQVALPAQPPPKQPKDGKVPPRGRSLGVNAIGSAVNAVRARRKSTIKKVVFGNKPKVDEDDELLGGW